MGLLLRRNQVQEWDDNGFMGVSTLYQEGVKAEAKDCCRISTLRSDVRPTCLYIVSDMILSSNLHLLVM